jgi:hypothetical protein
MVIDPFMQLGSYKYLVLTQMHKQPEDALLRILGNLAQKAECGFLWEFEL